MNLLHFENELVYTILRNVSKQLPKSLHIQRLAFAILKLFTRPKKKLKYNHISKLINRNSDKNSEHVLRKYEKRQINKAEDQKGRGR